MDPIPMDPMPMDLKPRNDDPETVEAIDLSRMLMEQIERSEDVQVISLPNVSKKKDESQGKITIFENFLN